MERPQIHYEHTSNHTFFLKLIMKEHMELGPGDSEAVHLFSNDPVDVGIYWIMVLGRVIGAVPHSIGWRQNRSIIFKFCSLSSLHTTALIAGTLAYSVPDIYWHISEVGKHSTILDEMLALEQIAFLFSMLIVYIYFIKNAGKIIQVFRQFSATSFALNLNTKDEKFPRFCLILAAFVLGIGITENILWDFSIYSNKKALMDGKSMLEKAYIVNGKTFATLVPYHPIISIVIVYVIKVSTYCWNFGDIFLIIMCRAVKNKFHQVNEEINLAIDEFRVGKLWRKAEDKNDNKSDPNFQLAKISHKQCQTENISYACSPVWNIIRDKVLLLCDLGENVASLVSSILLSCLLGNCYYIILNGLSFLYEPKSSKDRTYYVYVSTFQFTMRVVLVTYYASEIFHSTENIVKTLERCPDDAFTLTAERLQRMLCRHPVKVTIFGALEITKKFFISLLSFIFTTEIVLMQAMSATKR